MPERMHYNDDHICPDSDQSEIHGGVGQGLCAIRQPVKQKGLSSQNEVLKDDKANLQKKVGFLKDTKQFDARGRDV